MANQAPAPDYAAQQQQKWQSPMPSPETNCAQAPYYGAKQQQPQGQSYMQGQMSQWQSPMANQASAPDYATQQQQKCQAPMPSPKTNCAQAPYYGAQQQQQQGQAFIQGQMTHGQAPMPASEPHRAPRPNSSAQQQQGLPFMQDSVTKNQSLLYRASDHKSGAKKQHGQLCLQGSMPQIQSQASTPISVINCASAPNSGVQQQQSQASTPAAMFNCAPEPTIEVQNQAAMPVGEQAGIKPTSPEYKALVNAAYDAELEFLQEYHANPRNPKIVVLYLKAMTALHNAAHPEDQIDTQKCAARLKEELLSVPAEVSDCTSAIALDPSKFIAPASLCVNKAASNTAALESQAQLASSAAPSAVASVDQDSAPTPIPDEATPCVVDESATSSSSNEEGGIDFCNATDVVIGADKSTDKSVQIGGLGLAQSADITPLLGRDQVTIPLTLGHDSATITPRLGHDSAHKSVGNPHHVGLCATSYMNSDKEKGEYIARARESAPPRVPTPASPEGALASSEASTELGASELQVQGPVPTPVSEVAVELSNRALASSEASSELAASELQVQGAEPTQMPEGIAVAKAPASAAPCVAALGGSSLSAAQAAEPPKRTLASSEASSKLAASELQAQGAVPTQGAAGMAVAKAPASAAPCVAAFGGSSPSAAQASGPSPMLEASYKSGSQAGATVQPQLVGSTGPKERAVAAALGQEEKLEAGVQTTAKAASSEAALKPAATLVEAGSTPQPVGSANLEERTVDDGAAPQPVSGAVTVEGAVDAAPNAAAEATQATARAKSCSSFLVQAVAKTVDQVNRDYDSQFSRYRDKPDPDEVRQILAHLDCSNRELWVQVFCVLGRVYPGNTDILAIAREWSAANVYRQPQDKEQEEHFFFKASHHEGPGIGVLLLEAQTHGYEVPRSSEPYIKAYLDSVEGKAAAKKAVTLQSPDSYDDPSDKARHMYDAVQVKSCAIVKYWLYVAGNDSVQNAARTSFVCSCAKYLSYLPDGPRSVLEAMREYCIEHATYSYQAFRDWLSLVNKQIEPEVFAEVLSSVAVTSEEHAYDCLKEVYQISYRLLARADSLRVADAFLDLSFEETVSAVNKHCETLQPVSEVKSNNKEQWADDVYAMCLERTDPELANNHFISTGHSVLDEHIMGFHRKGVTIFASHAGVGKSWFGVDSCYSVLRHNPKARVLFISTEMTVEEIELRLFGVYNNVGILNQDIQRYRDSGQLEGLVENFRNFCHSDCDIKIIGADQNGMDINFIESTVTELSAEKRLDLVVIDYLQNIQNTALPKNSLTYERVRDTMRRLCSMARIHDCAVLALTQLNNPNKKPGDNSSPNIYDIAESSYSCQDADAVIIMHEKPGAKKDQGLGGGVGPGFSDDCQGNLFDGIAGGTGGTGGAQGAGEADKSGLASKKSKALFGNERFFNETDLLLSVCKSRNGFNTATPLVVRRSAGSRFEFAR